MSLGIARRRFVGGLLALFGVVIVGGGAYESLRLHKRRFARTPYDDLFDKLGDRDSTRLLGRQALREDATFDAERTAKLLRHKLKHKNLADVLGADARSDRLAEVRGWVLPQTLVALAALTAKSG